MHRAAIALGSNLASSFGEPAENLREALRRMSALGQVEAVSSFHVTEPIGFIEQPRFVNGACVLHTTLGAGTLLCELLQIERSMGRVRVVDKGPRIIDLDLILYDDLACETDGLTLPHPEMHCRGFVLAPLAEIAPDWVHPLLGLSVAQLHRGDTQGA